MSWPADLIIVPLHGPLGSERECATLNMLSTCLTCLLANLLLWLARNILTLLSGKCSVVNVVGMRLVLRLMLIERLVTRWPVRLLGR